LLGLLDECVQNDDALAHRKTVKSSANSFAASGPQLKEPISECARVRQAKTRAVFSQKFDQARVVRDHIDWPRFNFGKNALVKKPISKAIGGCYQIR
jgi:hypothetical protein